MTRYFVIAKKWSEDEQAQVDYIAGEFPNYNLAKIFKDAYNHEYRTHAIILEEANLVNHWGR